jgi:hypothetical protein
MVKPVLLNMGKPLAAQRVKLPASRALVDLAIKMAREESVIMDALGFAVEAGDAPEVIRQAERLVDRKMGCKSCKATVYVGVAISVWKLSSRPKKAGSVGSERSLPAMFPAVG